MRTKIAIALSSLFLFSSCIVKSINPFYTPDKLSFSDKLVGKFIDKAKGQWEITAFKDAIEEDKEEAEQSKETKEALLKYSNGYAINYIKKEKEALFIGMPFKVDKQLFLDFTPFEYEDDGLNNLAAQHLLKTHSVAKVDIKKDGTVVFSWLAESVVKELFNNNKIRLKHEKTGLEEDLILTASSEELYRFLETFIKSDIEEKWDKDERYTLSPSNGTP